MAVTLNALVIASVLIAIPVVQRDREMMDPIFLVAFFNQMELLGFIGFCLAVGELIVNLRRSNRKDTILAMVGMGLSLTPSFVGTATLRIVSHFMGWRIE